jgi:four helix bundle protein
MDLVETVYKATSRFPQREVYGLSSQLPNAAVSIPSNIAEGQSRQSTRDFLNFPSITRGSLAEVETQILLAQRLNYIDDTQRGEIIEAVWEVARLLNGLMKSLRSDE